MNEYFKERKKAYNTERKKQKRIQGQWMKTKRKNQKHANRNNL